MINVSECDIFLQANCMYRPALQGMLALTFVNAAPRTLIPQWYGTMLNFYAHWTFITVELLANPANEIAWDIAYTIASANMCKRTKTQSRDIS